MRNNLLSFILIILLLFSLDMLAQTKEPKVLLSSIEFVTLESSESLCPNTVFEIKWQGVLASDTVKLEYSTNGGISWLPITDKATGLSYLWTVPNTPSNNCIARVTSRTNITQSDTVKICNQIWMTKNLDVDHYRNGDPIPQIINPTSWGLRTTGAWCYYNNDPAMGAIYGKLYNWYAVNDPRGLAPEGWHIPTDEEWTELENCLGGSNYAGGKLKSTGTKEAGDGLWYSPNTGATNESGFSAQPGGFRWPDGQFGDTGTRGEWWTSTWFNSEGAWRREMSNFSRGIFSSIPDKDFGLSVRCLKDQTVSNIPKINNINPNSGFVGDEVTINGSGFGAAQGTISFTGANATSILSWGDNQIKLQVPTGAQTGKVFVTVNSVKSNEVDFTVNTQPSNEVKICNQVWMTKNLDVDHYRNGDPIPEVTDPNTWTNLTTGAWCYYNNDPAMGVIYGKLYNWYAVNDPRGLAPEGWHIPTDEEWTELVNCLGGSNDAGGKLKSIGTKEAGDGLWYSPNTGATNESGFSAQPSGYLYLNGSFSSIGSEGIWWSATENDSSLVWTRKLSFRDIFVFRREGNMRYGFSVRCVKGSSGGITPNINNITPNSGFIGDEVTINGSGFGATQGTISFTGANATSISSWGNTQIILKVPLFAQTGKVFVTVNSVKSNEVDFTVQTQQTNEVKICNQVWMTKNLDVDRYRNGDPIPQITDPFSWAITKTGAWCYYDGNPANGAIYGKLYNWYAVNDARGLAPEGWHIPTDAEWKELEMCLGMSKADANVEGWRGTTEGGKLKQIGTFEGGGGLWANPNTGATNELGFTALPGGIYLGKDHGGAFLDYYFLSLKYGGWWWSSSESFSRELNYNRGNISRQALSENTGMSVRCLKDQTVSNILKINNINPNSGFIGDEVTINGSGFGATQGTISFTGANATSISSWGNTQIILKVPLFAQTGKVFVTVNSIKSNEVDFTVQTQQTNEVKICNQVWMTKNLDVDHYRNGDPILEVTDPDTWSSLTTGAWCYYNNDPANGAIYGKLYNWYAVNDSRGLAPAGWHIPSDEEWTELENCLGGSNLAGGRLKEEGTTHWLSPNSGATNESGFTALPGGCRDALGAFTLLGNYNYLWTSSMSNGSYSWYRILSGSNNTVYRYGSDKSLGFTVRCVRD